MAELCQTGKVVGVSGKNAIVRFVRSDACGHCNACFRFGSNESDIEIENSCKAVVNDVVAIELRSGSVLKASAIAYGIPLVGLVAGVFVGSLISDVYAIVGGILLCGATYFILRGLNPKFARMNEFKPCMIRIVGHEED